jgi:predicted O-linked N-acetylglucosamine transferase (SPINDLY family)
MFAWLRSRLFRTPAAVAPVDLSAMLSLAISAGLPSAADLARAAAQLDQGNRQREKNQPQAAELHYRHALAIHPGYAEAYSNLGSLLKDRGLPAEADNLLSLAVQLKPELGPACFNLAMLRIDQSRWGDAVALLQRSLASHRNHADAHYWLGNALMGLGDAVGARSAYLAAIRVDANHVQARWGNVMAQLPAIPRSEAEQSQAPDAFARELEKLKAWFRTSRPANAYLAVGAQQPYYLAYISRNHRDVLASYGALCADLMATWSKTAGIPAPVGKGHAKCRVGIVSAHIHNHSVWHALLRGWIEHLDPAKFELQIFHTGATRDSETEWASRRVSKLHHAVGHWSNWAKVISDAQLDALIYPEIGMDATTVRLSALRLARVQLASWGHPISSGLPTIDGFISAQAFEPSEGATHYSEKLLQLPRLGCCYRPFGTKPSRLDLSALGIQPTDKILLCAGTPFKYAPVHDPVLAEIARRCQPCKLIFFRSAPEGLAALLEQRLRASFELAGLNFDDCVRFIPWQSQPDFFALLDRADVYLDSIGFSGFNTTMQAIERGTPIVAFEGEFMRGRFASAILRQIGLDEWVANSAEQYAQLAERLASDKKARDLARRQIADRRQQLFDDQETAAVFGKQLTALCG